MCSGRSVACAGGLAPHHQVGTTTWPTSLGRTGKVRRELRGASSKPRKRGVWAGPLSFCWLPKASILQSRGASGCNSLRPVVSDRSHTLGAQADPPPRPLAHTAHSPSPLRQTDPPTWAPRAIRYLLEAPPVVWRPPRVTHQGVRAVKDPPAPRQASNPPTQRTILWKPLPQPEIETLRPHPVRHPGWGTQASWPQLAVSRSWAGIQVPTPSPLLPVSLALVAH